MNDLLILPMITERDGVPVTTSRALAFKVAYINAFNRMEQLLTGRAEAQAFPAQPPSLPPFSDRFLGAIRQALDSGRYTLHRKGRPDAVLAPGGEIIGAYDEHDVTLSTSAALAIYKAATGDHLSLSQLRTLLVSEGAALDDRGRSRGRKINGREVQSVRIPRALLNRPL